MLNSLIIREQVKTQISNDIENKPGWRSDKRLRAKSCLSSVLPNLKKTSARGWKIQCFGSNCLWMKSWLGTIQVKAISWRSFPVVFFFRWPCRVCRWNRDPLELCSHKWKGMECEGDLLHAIVCAAIKLLFFVGKLWCFSPFFSRCYRMSRKFYCKEITVVYS